MDRQVLRNCVFSPPVGTSAMPILRRRRRPRAHTCRCCGGPPAWLRTCPSQSPSWLTAARSLETQRRCPVRMCRHADFFLMMLPQPPLQLKAPFHPAHTRLPVPPLQVGASGPMTRARPHNHGFDIFRELGHRVPLRRHRNRRGKQRNFLRAARPCGILPSHA